MDIPGISGFTHVLIAAGGISAVVATFRVFAERRKLNADATTATAAAAETLTGTALGLLAPLREEMAAQSRALTVAEDRVAHLRAEILARDVRLFDQAEQLAEARAEITQLSMELAEARAEITHRNHREDQP